VSDELRQAVVRWSTDYNRMDCDRIRDAKPLMDALWQRIASLERTLEERDIELSHLRVTMKMERDRLIAATEPK